MDDDDTRHRAGSTCSSRSRDSVSSWTLLNAQGSDSEMPLNAVDKASDSGSLEFEAVAMNNEEEENGSIVDDSEDDDEVAEEAEEADEDLDSTLSAEEGAILRDQPLLDSDDDDDIDRVPSDEEVEDDDDDDEHDDDEVEDDEHADDEVVDEEHADDEVVDDEHADDEVENEEEDDDMSIVDENEGLEDPAARMYVDTAQVTRLLDALSAHRSTGCQSDDLPVNFVSMCSNRVKNYMHRSNSRLNSKLTILLVIVTAIVTGVGIGHFIGTTHSWLKRNRLANEQLGQMKELQDNLVSCLGKLENSDARTCWGRPDLQYQATSAPNRLEGTCDAIEKPSCRANLVKCEQQLYDAKTDYWRKSAVHRYIMHSATQHQHLRRNNGSDHAATLLWRATRRLRRAERQLDAVQQRLRHQTAELNMQRAVSQRLMTMETAFKQHITQAHGDKERTMQALREASENVRHLQESLGSCRRDLGKKSTHTPPPSLDDIFGHLAGSNISETLTAYLDLARRVRLMPDSVWKFGEQNGQIVVDQLEQIRHVFDRLQSAARERLGDLKTLATANDLSEYYDGARALSVQMGTALTRVWRETREVAQTVVRDFTDDHTRDQIVAIVRDLGRSAERLQAEVEESLPAVVQDGWTRISARIQSTFDRILSFDATEDEEAAPSMEQTPRPTPADQQTCEGLRQLGRALDKAKLGDIVGKQHARRFIDARLFHFPCTLPSVGHLHFLACQKCWWMSDCIGLADPSRCDWEDWQRSYRLDAQRLYRDHPRVLRVLVDVLHWQSSGPSSFDAEPPCLVRDNRGYCEAVVNRPSTEFDVPQAAPSTDWLFNRDVIRRSERQMEERAEWQFKRSATRDDQRRQLRTGYEQAEWLFQRGKERAHQRRDHSRKQSDDEEERGWFDRLLKREKGDRKEHKDAKRQQHRREKPRQQHHFRHQSMFGGPSFEV
uniref:Uncharacterized protein n=1 Tax=Plectus sambesii TaxID=2011161 RepID=A0A914WVZ4_9BILA